MSDQIIDNAHKTILIALQGQTLEIYELCQKLTSDLHGLQLVNFAENPDILPQALVTQNSAWLLHQEISLGIAEVLNEQS